MKNLIYLIAIVALGLTSGCVSEKPKPIDISKYKQMEAVGNRHNIAPTRSNIDLKKAIHSDMHKL